MNRHSMEPLREVINDSKAQFFLFNTKVYELEKDMVPVPFLEGKSF